MFSIDTYSEPLELMRKLSEFSLGLCDRVILDTVVKL